MTRSTNRKDSETFTPITVYRAPQVLRHPFQYIDLSKRVPTDLPRPEVPTHDSTNLGLPCPGSLEGGRTIGRTQRRPISRPYTVTELSLLCVYIHHTRCLPGPRNRGSPTWDASGGTVRGTTTLLQPGSGERSKRQGSPRSSLRGRETVRGRSCPHCRHTQCWDCSSGPTPCRT